MTNDIRGSLSQINKQEYGSNIGLMDLMKATGQKSSTKNKGQLVEELYLFYSTPSNAEILYNRLTEYEKDLLQCVVQSKNKPLWEDLLQIAKQHKMESKSYYSYDSQKWKTLSVQKTSAFMAFFIGGQIPHTFMPFLEKVIPKYKRKFLPCDVGDINDHEYIIGREERYTDFDMLLSFINSNSPAATKAGEYISKVPLLKFHKLAGYSEICNNDSGIIDDIRNTGQAIISTGLVRLLRVAKVIDLVKGKYVTSDNAGEYASLTMPEKAKFLFDAYIRHGKGIIDECTRISSAKLRILKTNYNLSSVRSEIISYLKECPRNEWVEFSQFTKEIRKANRDLFYVVGSVMVRDDYHNAYYSRPSWKQFEHAAISVVLLEYLTTLGAVDVIIEDVCHSDYGYGYSGWEVSYFRVTCLGAYLFGLTDSYEPKKPENFTEGETGFVVQPNFDVVIQNSRDRMRHELFFSRFADKTLEDEHVTVFNLDFKAMVRCLDIGMKISEVLYYCKNFSSVPLPENVEKAFADWEKQSSRIRIRTVTVIEADDPVLLEELKSYRGMGALLNANAVTPVLMLNSGADKKAKTLIEKNKRFCVLGM
ncbi:MAG: helicase-associated domain-containing protein [Defluviitaleaceae bacterium]|nr:helicase-associated domain-containing protein [Defluviitaleaceae bacterium]